MRLWLPLQRQAAQHGHHARAEPRGRRGRPTRTGHGRKVQKALGEVHQHGPGAQFGERTIETGIQRDADAGRPQEDLLFKSVCSRVCAAGEFSQSGRVSLLSAPFTYETAATKHHSALGFMPYAATVRFHCRRRCCRCLSRRCHRRSQHVAPTLSEFHCRRRNGPDEFLLRSTGTKPSNVRLPDSSCATAATRCTSSAVSRPAHLCGSVFKLASNAADGGRCGCSHRTPSSSSCHGRRYSSSSAVEQGSDRTPPPTPHVSNLGRSSSFCGPNEWLSGLETASYVNCTPQTTSAGHPSTYDGPSNGYTLLRTDLRSSALYATSNASVLSCATSPAAADNVP
jgi:hypothetical protein